MTTFPGFTLPPELVALREQVRRIVRDELLPIEQRIDPDAPEIPEGRLPPPRGEDQGGGPLVPRRPGALRWRRSRHVRHVRRARRDGPASDGPLQRGLRRVRPVSAAGDRRRHARADRGIRGARPSRRVSHFLRDLIWEGAWKADRGEDARVEASIAKLYSSEALGRVIDKAVQVHGGYGVSKEFPLERWYREARVRRIGEGPSEVHRMVIARSLFR